MPPEEKEDVTERVWLRKASVDDVALIAPSGDDEPEMEELKGQIRDQIESQKSCDICGTYLVFKDDTKIGLVTLSNGSQEYYTSSSHIYGFDTGEYIDRTIFLDRIYVGKGYFQQLHTAVMDLITPFLGRTHCMLGFDGKLTMSSKPLKGTRGLIDLSNIPSLRAGLKAGGTLAWVDDDHEHWIMEFPERMLSNKAEEALLGIAGKIIDASLFSFQIKNFEGVRQTCLAEASLLIQNDLESSGTFDRSMRDFLERIISQFVQNFVDGGNKEKIRESLGTRMITDEYTDSQKEFLNTLMEKVLENYCHEEGSIPSTIIARKALSTHYYPGIALLI